MRILMHFSMSARSISPNLQPNQQSGQDWHEKHSENPLQSGGKCTNHSLWHGTNSERWCYNDIPALDLWCASVHNYTRENRWIKSQPPYSCRKKSPCGWYLFNRAVEAEAGEAEDQPRRDIKRWKNQELSAHQDSVMNWNQEVLRLRVNTARIITTTEIAHS